MLYEYLVLDYKNRRNKGIVDAASVNEAKSILRDKRFFILEIKEQHGNKIKEIFFKKSKNKLNFNSLVNFTRQMGIMINAGLSLIDALSILNSQTVNIDERLIISKIEEYIKGGNPMSTALKNFPESFPDYYISLVKAGESSGKLDDVFLRLADNLERSKEFRSKVTNSMIYPIVIIVVITIVAFVMMTFVLPKLLKLYSNFDVELPMATKIIIALSDFFANFWLAIIVFVFVAIWAISELLKNKQNQKILDSYLIKIPVFGSIIQKSVLVETTRTLGILIKSGVHILEALEIVQESSSNLVYREAFKTVYEKVEKGETLAEAFADTELFPPIFIQLTGVGEKTGKLDDTLIRLSNYFQLESEMAVKAATTLIEPAILAVLGVGVGFLIISILMPIYNLTSSFGGTQ